MELTATATTEDGLTATRYAAIIDGTEAGYLLAHTSGLILNVYFAVLALAAGFVVATLLALAKFSRSPFLSKPASGFIFLFRGSPLFIQFFLAYEAFVLLPRAGIARHQDEVAALIRLQDMVIVQFSMQIIIKHCQISVRTLDGPVGHVLAGNRQAVPFKLLFLAVKGNGIDIFCVHDGSLQRWRY